MYRGTESEWAVPQTHVVDKNKEGHLGSEGSQPQTRTPNPGLQCQKDPITSGCKNQWGLGQWKKLQDSQETPLKGTTMNLGGRQTHHSGI